MYHIIPLTDVKAKAHGDHPALKAGEHTVLPAGRGQGQVVRQLYLAGAARGATPAEIAAYTAQATAAKKLKNQ